MTTTKTYGLVDGKLMKKNVTLIGGTGLTGNGKTTILDLLAILLNINNCGCRIIRAEMSKIIGRLLKLHGPLSDEIRKFVPLMEAGGYLPDHVAIPAFEMWLNAVIDRYPQVESILIGGLPRTMKQKEKVKGLFKGTVFIDTKINPDKSLQSIIERLKHAEATGAEIRKDDAGGVVVFQNRLTEFKNHTVPMLNSCNGDLISLNREQELEERLEQALVHIREMHEPVIPKNIVTKGLNRLYSRSHRVHDEIRRVRKGQGITPELVTYI